MPSELFKELLRVALLDAKPAQRVVIDSCAGFRSLEQPTLEQGLMCMPVDIKWRKSARSLQDPHSDV